MLSNASAQNTQALNIDAESIEAFLKTNEFGQRFYKYNKTDIEFRNNYITLIIQSRLYGLDMFEAYRFLIDDRKHYTIHDLDLFFKEPNYPDINYKPIDFSKKSLADYQNLMQSRQILKETKTFFKDQAPIDKVMSRAVYTHPEFVDHVWEDIADVANIGRHYMQRRAVDKAIRSMLRDTFNTKPNLERIIIEKSPWTLEGTENIQLSQGYIDNWAKGGESSVSLSSDLRLKANYAKDKHSWENYIIHKIGVLSVQDESTSINDDLIEINTKYGLKSSEKWYYSFLYNFKTQFFYGYEGADRETPISGFLAPAYMSFAIGMDYKPNTKFTLLLSPLTSRLTIVADSETIDPTKYGVEVGENIASQNGLSIVNNFVYQISKEINLTSKLDVFSEYKINDPFVQADWEVILDMRINRFLSTRIVGHLRYFTNESDRLQFKETFNIAFKYNF
ncbi:DUF3078 domain-containing protein [Carboxylicivirga sp. N1Y90]|uniref:DUF3078 domain-containing protein n=1 Tax=Carboxylicivirga fragile TaxID=3417571 RepID=UPI003D34C691|nr:DUF3078 domain-containing protein [Marinilabiliaceae bacterium N1Y90]